MSGQKVRIFGLTKKDSNPKPITFQDNWDPIKLLEKAKTKLKSDVSFTHMLTSTGEEIKQLSEIQPESKIIFIVRENIESSTTPEPAAPKDAAPTGPSTDGETQESPAPKKGLFEKIFDKDSKGVADDNKKDNLFSNLFKLRTDKGVQQPELKDGVAAQVDVAAVDGAAAGATSDDPPVEGEQKEAKWFNKAFKSMQTWGKKMEAVASEVVRENHEKIKEVIEKAKNAMDEVGERHRQEEGERRIEGMTPSAGNEGKEQSSAQEEVKLPIVAAAEVQVLKIRCCEAAKQLYATVSVEGTPRTTDEAKVENGGADFPQPRAPFRFSISDPAGDIRITIYDPHNHRRRDRKIGRVLIPLKWLWKDSLGLTGWGSYEGWMHIMSLPQDAGVADILTQQLGGVQAKTNIELQEKKFFQAIPKEKGSGLPEPRYPLGQVYIKLNAYSAEGGAAVAPNGLAALARSYVEPPKNGSAFVTWRLVDTDVDIMLAEEGDDKVLSVDGINRIIFRLKNLFKGPPLVMKPPFSIMTFIWLYYVCFRMTVTMVPWMIWTLLFIQGVSLYFTRDLSDTIIWESQIKKEKSKTVFEYGALVRKVLRIIGAYQYKAELVISTLERLKNVLSGGDVFATMFLFSVLAVLALVGQFIIAITPMGLPFFMIGFGILSGPYFKLLRKIRGKKKKKDDWVDVLLKILLFRTENFLNHVPDADEMAHRHICEMQKVTELKTGGDVKEGKTAGLDAAIAANETKTDALDAKESGDSKVASDPDALLEEALSEEI